MAYSEKSLNERLNSKLKEAPGTACVKSFRSLVTRTRSEYFLRENIVAESP